MDFLYFCQLWFSRGHRQVLIYRVSFLRSCLIPSSFDFLVQYLSGF
jgi:hypothetical protein